MTKLIFSSPHSGTWYPNDLKFRTDILEVRRAEDSYVDELFSESNRIGANCIKADFARWFCDVNRAPFELSPDFIEDPPEDLSITGNAKFGIGTVHALTFHGKSIYQSKLKFEEILDRIEKYYRPYHSKLEKLIPKNESSILIDCHSMPSSGRKNVDKPRPDFILGNDRGRTCSEKLMNSTKKFFERYNYTVECNTIYAGGFITRHYANNKCQTLQIEINRKLYLNELTLEKLPNFNVLQERLSIFCHKLSENI